MSLLCGLSKISLEAEGRSLLGLLVPHLEPWPMVNAFRNISGGEPAKHLVCVKSDGLLVYPRWR